jgi:hypothetical protein
MFKINLTKKQCESLIKLVFIGEWVCNATTTERNPDMEDCLQAVYRQIYDQGNKDIFDFDKAKGSVFLNEEKETECLETIDDHNDVVFWDILNEYLSERDLRQNYTETEIEKLDKDVFLDLYYKIQDKYSEEFENNGVDNLHLNSSLPDFLKKS